MKVLICGSEGSLMQATIPVLISEGHEITGVDNLGRYGERLNLTKSDYHFVKADLNDPWQVDRIFNEYKPEVVIQAAARIYGVGGFNKYCADILGQDVALHSNIIQSCAKYGVEKLVYISSSMVYERCIQNKKVAVTETMPELYPAPATEYGLSKFVGERLTVAAKKQYDINYVIWRPFNIITPYERADKQEIGISHVFADYMHNLLTEKMNPLPIIGDGNQIRCFTWIDEVAYTVGMLSFDKKATNEVFNVGNAEPITMKNLAKLIYREGVEKNILTNKPLSFIVKAEYENDVKVRIPSMDKFEKTFGWKPIIPVSESISRCVEHYMEKNNGYH